MWPWEQERETFLGKLEPPSERYVRACAPPVQVGFHPDSNTNAAKMMCSVLTTSWSQVLNTDFIEASK